ncbi:MAG: hypothetical protein KF845_15675 [Cyclobacteriaceae bacterium]|nr:hypothetical protein [Cyclobacteriaceae bacterium]
MTKIFSVICLLLVSSHINAAMGLDYIRENYDKAVSDKNLCKTMIEELKPKQNNTVYLAYLGGLQTIWANHTINPISKLNTFNEGKKNIEKAVNDEPNNIEIRFVRLSVQKNTPSFLGYNHQIKEDEHFLKNNRHHVVSPVLLKLINELLNTKDTP